MNANLNLKSQLESLIDNFGQLAVESELDRLKGVNKPNNVCTILINRGLHSFPEHLFHGDVFVFYEGSLDLSSPSVLHAFVADRLIALREFLQSKKWQDVHIVISGHAAVCMQVKLAVYRITHIETTDWVFDGAGEYIPLLVPLRKLLGGE